MGNPIRANEEPIPGYFLRERLGRGGFGEVWRVEAPGGLSKAIKFVFGEIDVDGDDGREAAQELKALSRMREIRHPFVLTVERVDVVHGQLMIVMELADMNLDQRLRADQHDGLAGIPRPELLKYMSEMAEVLDVMSSTYDLQHLDIKPQNLFLVGKHAKVGDFGLVKDLEGFTAKVTGGVTPVYAAPETFEGWVSRASDQYSLAIVFQELLTGRRPFNGPSTKQYMMQHIMEEPDLSSLPADDRDIVGRALSKDPNNRFSNCEELVAALIAAGSGVSRVRLALPTLTADDGGPVDSSMDLVNQSTRMSTLRAGSTTTGSDSSASLSQLPLQTSPTGTLVPTLVIGLGKTGLRCLGRLHSKLRSRFGESADFPPIRLLGIDTDSHVLPKIQKHEPVSPEMSDRLLLCKLRRATQYLNHWDQFKHLESWLDQQAIFQLDNTGTTHGYRVLGRLALFDNYRRIVTRLRSELHDLLAVPNIQRAMESTGLDLRRKEPRIFLIGHMGGGTASGMSIDLSFLLAQVLRDFGIHSPDVHGLFVSGRVTGHDRAASSNINHYALAQDLLDLDQPETEFRAQYEPEAEPVVGKHRPMRSVTFFDWSAEHVPDPKDTHVMDAIGDYALDWSTTALGGHFDNHDRQLQWGPYRSMGWFAVAHPRAQLVRRTACRLAESLIERWTDPLPRSKSRRLAEEAKQSLADGNFNPGNVRTLLLDEAFACMEEPLDVMIDDHLIALRHQLANVGPAEAEPLVRRAYLEIQEWIELDRDHENSDWEDTSSDFESAITQATNRVAQSLLEPLQASVLAVLSKPGRRLSAGKHTWEGFAQYFLQILDEQQDVEQISLKTVNRRAREIESRLDSRAKREPEEWILLLEQYAQEKIHCRLAKQIVQLYLVLRGRISDQLRDFVSAGQTLDQLQEQMQVAYKHTKLYPDYCMQNLFAGGQVLLRNAAEELHNQLWPDLAQELEEHIEQELLESAGGVLAFTQSDEGPDTARCDALLEILMQWVAERSVPLDAAQCFIDRHRLESINREHELQAFVDWARPTMGADEDDDSSGVVLGGSGLTQNETLLVRFPDSDAGLEMLAHLKSALNDDNMLAINQGDDGVFCRVRAEASLSKLLPKWLLKLRQSYDSARQTPYSPEIFPQPPTQISSAP